MVSQSSGYDRGRSQGRSGPRQGTGAGSAGRRVSTIRVVSLVVLGALLQVVVAPYLDLGFFAPALAILCVIVAAAGLKWSVALPVGFFGGTLVDALGAGLFGVGALSGVLAAALSSRAGVLDGGEADRMRLAGTVALAVAAHDLLSVAALGLSGDTWPPMLEFVALGVLPDSALNGVLAYLAGGVLLRLVLVKDEGWL